MMDSLERYIKLHSESIPDKTALICGDRQITYKQLWNRVLEHSCQLQQLKDKILIRRASQSIEFLIEYFAAHLAGKVFVPLEKDIPGESFSAIEQSLNGYNVPEGVADILYTTGTTGRRKGTMLSHSAIIANADNLITAQLFNGSLTFVISGPLNHIGSLSKVWPMIIVGGSILITEGMKDINAFFSALDYPCEKIATFLVPSSIRMILQFGEDKLKSYSNKIDFIETGAAPISEDDMKKLCRLLPKSRLYNTYASTETGIICTHNFNMGYCVPGCLGKPMKNSSVAISGEGTIYCSGKTLMTGYANDEELTLKVLKEGVVYTNDRGEIDVQGRLQLSGRNDDIINVGGYKVNPIEVENEALSFPDVSDCICIADQHPVIGTALRLLVVCKEGKVLDKKQIGKFLIGRLEKYKVPHMYSQVESVKRTYNGKPDRKYYADLQPGD